MYYYNRSNCRYYFGILFRGGGRPGRQAGWIQILVQNVPILVENEPIFDQIGQIPVGGRHIVCSRHSTPLVGPQHSPLFATQHSSGGTTALSSVRQQTPLLGPQHFPLLVLEEEEEKEEEEEEEERLLAGQKDPSPPPPPIPTSLLLPAET